MKRKIITFITLGIVTMGFTVAANINMPVKDKANSSKNNVKKEIISSYDKRLASWD